MFHGRGFFMRVEVPKPVAFLVRFLTPPTLDAERDPNMCIYMLDLHIHSP